MTTSFYSPDELPSLGFKAYGKNVLISRKASFYGTENITLGDNVRIDDFCLLSGVITLGNYVHIAAGVMLFAGTAGIIFEDFTTISSRGAVYAMSDDYSGAHMTNPMIPAKYSGVTKQCVRICRHCIIGTGCTVLPGVTLAEGCAVGAMSLIDRSTEPWGIYVGIPAVRAKERSRALLEQYRQFETELAEKREDS
ncbi:MAG: acyltransferase [Oscillospiraceae bacterium]|nr:acyltransferase [Oscillospiraceae bacterium]